MKRFRRMEVEVVSGRIRGTSFYFNLYVVTPEILQYFFAQRSQPVLCLEMDKDGTTFVTLDGHQKIKPGDCLAVGEHVSNIYENVEQAIEKLDLIRVENKITTFLNPQNSLLPL